jgi:FSR family fosmidomycin resistance protein-like MFS transporter
MASETPALAVPLRASAPSLARTDFFAFALFSIGHFFIDMYSSGLSTLQPLLGDKLGLSLTQAGVLASLMVFSSSVMQPAYGVLSDRFHTRLFTVLAPAVAGIFVSLLGVAPNYGWLILMVVLGGAGVASFHPQASSRATAGITENRGRWMAIFISSGTLGLAVGPTYYSAVVTRFGLASSYWAAAPGVALTLLLLCFLPDTAPPAHARTGFDLRPLRAVWKPLTVLYLLVFIRSIVQVVYTQLLPLYLHRERGFSLVAAGLGLSLYLAAGAVGGFLGGHIADRFGGRRVILVSMAGCVPFLALFFVLKGPLSMISLALAGLTLLFTTPVNVVMAQDLVPAQAGTISALMMGFAWGTAGFIFIPLTGWAGDHYTLGTALAALGLFPILGFFLALKLPK